MRFVATDRGKLELLALMILVLALGGQKLGEAVAKNLVSSDAQATANAWATSLAASAEDLPGLIAGVTPSNQTLALLKQARAVDNIYRYKVWDRAGNLAFASDQISASLSLKTLAGQLGARSSASILSGSSFTAASAGKPPENPAYFSESYVPITRNGSLIGVLEVYVDQTKNEAVHQRSFRFFETMIALAILLAGGLSGFTVYRKMMAHRKEQAEALFMTEHDGVTGLPTLRRVGEAARIALAWARRNNAYVAALLFDLDRFKEVNDSLGHDGGDEVLEAFAGRLKATVREQDIVTRLGGDEFLVLQAGLAQPLAATTLAHRLLKILSVPYEIGGRHAECAASIGIAIAPTDADNWDALLSCADTALLKAKTEGRNSVRFFEAGMNVVFRERRRLEGELRRALATSAFQLAFQPLFGFEDGRLMGFEALLRWPDGWTQQSPAEFIPVAEGSGLIVPIGTWVLETACRAAASWKHPVKVAVNLSPVQFRQGDIVAVVDGALRVSGLDPGRLELEVTESLWLQNTDKVLEQLESLQRLGVSIALDDFGTGYSSLTYLCKFPFDRVKIDRSFVADVAIDRKAAAIVNTIVALGRTLHLGVTAEGVETAAQAAALRRAGCDEVQGYLFGRPLNAAAADILIQENRRLLPA